MAQRVVIPGFRKIETSGGGEGGTTNYADLENKPSINNIPLVGNLNTVNLKLTDATLTEEGVPAEAKTVGAKLAEQSTSLTALSEQLGSHTVRTHPIQTLRNLRRQCKVNIFITNLQIIIQLLLMEMRKYHYY